MRKRDENKTQFDEKLMLLTCSTNLGTDPSFSI